MTGLKCPLTKWTRTTRSSDGWGQPSPDPASVDHLYIMSHTRSVQAEDWSHLEFDTKIITICPTERLSSLQHDFSPTLNSGVLLSTPSVQTWIIWTWTVWSHPYSVDHLVTQVQITVDPQTHTLKNTTWTAPRFSRRSRFTDVHVLWTFCPYKGFPVNKTKGTVWSGHHLEVLLFWWFWSECGTWTTGVEPGAHEWNLDYMSGTWTSWVEPGLHEQNQD